MGRSRKTGTREGLESQAARATESCEGGSESGGGRDGDVGRRHKVPQVESAAKNYVLRKPWPLGAHSLSIQQRSHGKDRLTGLCSNSDPVSQSII